MNGAATRKDNGFGPARSPPRAGPSMPNGKVLVEGYRKETLNGFDKEMPRLNPVRLSLCCLPMSVIG